MRRLHVRSIGFAMVLAIGITLLTAPAASAGHSVFLPAGLGCSFDVLAQATHLAEPVGVRAPVGFGDITMTNLDTGATYLQRSRYTATETFDSETNTLRVEVLGRIFLQFYPGDRGPSGEVGEPGALLAFSGSLQFTYDLDTELLTAFSYQGTFIDLCAELAS